MQSIFPAFGNGLGGGGGRNELVSFNAGKMTMTPIANGKFLIKPELKKGKVCLTRGDDQLLHFQWMDRQTGATPDDFIIFPDDASFVRADTGRDGDRVYLLQYKGSSRRFFFWMQNKDASRDEELATKLNDFMNNAAASAGANEARSGAGGGGSNSSNGQLDHNAIMQMLGAMGASGSRGGGSGGGSNAQNSVQVAELQNILQHLGLPPQSSATSSPATSAVSSQGSQHNGGGSSTAATTGSTTHEHDHDHDHEDDNDHGMEVDEMSEEELLRLAIEESMRDVNESPSHPPPPASGAAGTASGSSSLPAPARAPAPAAVPPPPQTQVAAPQAQAGASGGYQITTADLQRAMASFQALTRLPSVSLINLLRAENLQGIVHDEACIQRLLPLLPDGQQTPMELEATIRSPPFRQSVAALANALETGNFNAILTNFQLDPTPGASKLAVGDTIGAFLAAIQAHADQQHHQQQQSQHPSENH